MISTKENYLMMLRGEIPEYVPSYFDPNMSVMVSENKFGTPIYAPDGPVYSPWGVKFIGSHDNNDGAIPEPNNFILTDITKWRDVIKNPDLSHVDWEHEIGQVVKDIDRNVQIVTFGGADYFQTLISFMGFTEGLIAMFEEPEEVYAMMDYISEHNMYVMEQQIRYGKPDIFMIADDCAAARAPFFSPDMYKRLIKPFHKKHADLANENGVMLEKHDCGRCEDFIDDWIEMGIRGWNPAQTTNDLKGIKKKYLGKLALSGCWDNQGRISRPETSDEELQEALYEYADTFVPGGGFTFLAMVSGDREDERIIRKNKLIKDFYFDYVHDYYKKH